MDTYIDAEGNVWNAFKSEARPKNGQVILLQPPEGIINPKRMIYKQVLVDPETMTEYHISDAMHWRPA